jgi:hypothetical protein
MDSVAKQMKGKCICALGEFAVNPVVATIRHFSDDYDRAVLPPAPEPEPAAEAAPTAELVEPAE